jgi:hypothetical protein
LGHHLNLIQQAGHVGGAGSGVVVAFQMDVDHGDGNTLNLY